MRNRNKTDTRTLTRRTLLGGGLACVLASRASPGVAASGVCGIASRDRPGDLYVFSGARAATTVIAVTWPARFSSPRSEVRIHIGSHCRSVQTPDGNRSHGRRMGFSFSPALSCSTRKRPTDI